MLVGLYIKLYTPVDHVNYTNITTHHFHVLYLLEVQTGTKNHILSCQTVIPWRYHMKYIHHTRHYRAVSASSCERGCASTCVCESK